MAKATSCPPCWPIHPNIVAADIRRIEDIRLSANWMAACGEPGEDADLYDTVHAVGEEFCPALGIAIPVGKDSLSMKTAWKGRTAHARSLRRVADRLGVCAGRGRASHAHAAIATRSRRYAAVARRSGRRSRSPRCVLPGAGVRPDRRLPRRTAMTPAGCVHSSARSSNCDARN